MKILITEDDIPSRIILGKIAGQFCKEILFAKTGAEAVTACRNNSDIDLILMDIQMPVMNGYEATRLIREFNKEIIIIAQTAYALFGEKDNSKELGFNEYIPKPIDNTILCDIIRKYQNKTNRGSA